MNFFGDDVGIDEDARADDAAHDDHAGGVKDPIERRDRDGGTGRHRAPRVVSFCSAIPGPMTKLHPANGSGDARPI